MATVAEVPGHIQVFSDGTVKRFDDHAGTPSPDTPSFLFRDVTVDASKPITARIFLPRTVIQEEEEEEEEEQQQQQKEEEKPSSSLPVIVYFHGGGFCFCNTTWPNYTSFLGDLSARSRCVVFSVDYRLSPEHRLPIPYEDCYHSLLWLAAQKEPSLENADLTRVFLAGESAGGNIVHHVSLRLLRNPVEGLKVVRLLILHPFFGGKVMLEEENSFEDQSVAGVTDTLWRLSLPEGVDKDYPFCNFERSLGSEDADLEELPRTMISLAGKDFVTPRGVLYGKFLKAKGAKEVTVVIAEGEVHAYHIASPFSEATKLLQSRMAEFVNHGV